MTLLDLTAATAAFIAGSNVLFRAHMLRPKQRRWIEAPAVVWLALTGCALAMMMCAISILFGGHANSREAMIYSIEALGSFVMLWNLNKNGLQSEARRAEIAAEVTLVLEMSGRTATYPDDGL